MILPAARRLLPPICLAALVAAVWMLPYDPDCDSLAWGEDPAIARTGSQCILLSHYADWLSIIETAMENTEQGLLLDDQSGSDYHRRWLDRVNFYGPENIALAVSIKDSALYQRAVADGHTPMREEVSARIEQDRIRWETSYDLVSLAKLAQNRDFVAFQELAEETGNPELRQTLEDLTPLEFMETLEEFDWRQLEKILKEGEDYVEFFGHERFWQEIRPAKLRREMAIQRLEETVIEAEVAGGPYADVPRLAWLSHQQVALEGVNIELTRAAPPPVTVDRALAYLAEVLQEEQDELREKYRRWLERR